MSADFESKCKNFMFLYMYELEKAIRADIDELTDISFHSDEANTDRPLKEFIKGFIMGKLSRIQNINPDKIVEIILDEGIVSLSCKDFSDVYIGNVFLPDEITEDIKKKVRRGRNSVYTNPDLLFKITNGLDVEYIPVELKSTKDNAIPGSSIQQIDPEEWVIFIRHTKSSTEVTTGQYINGINSKLQFPDRSPRPQVAFSELAGWNESNRCESKSKVTYTITSSTEGTKHRLLNDWQDYLADKWIEAVFYDPKGASETWFNNNLRKFILKFMDKYEDLTDEEKKQYRERLSKMIKD